MAARPPHPNPLPVGERDTKNPRPSGERKASLRAGEGAYQPKPSLALRTNAKRLRRDSTDVEKKLWRALRNRQLAGVKFRRQFPVEGYVADFAAPEHRLIVELDGGQHNDEAARARDAARTARLEQSGWRLLRFWNNEVIENIDGVVEAIQCAISPSPQPSPRRGEG